MIKVNLAGTPKRKGGKSGAKFSAPANAMPIVLGLIVLAAGVAGYLWYDRLTTQNETLTANIAQLEAQKAALDAVIKQDAVFETRKKALENRIKIIEGLKRNQVSPVVSLDVLSDAINRTEYVWLANLDQNNTIFNMSGTGTSLNAIADFASNLEGTGFFKNINLANAQDASGNFTFSMSCEFSPPSVVKPEAIPSLGGAN
jgi:Tfp pilus assembly protein PilN